MMMGGDDGAASASVTPCPRTHARDGSGWVVSGAGGGAPATDRRSTEEMTGAPWLGSLASSTAPGRPSPVIACPPDVRAYVRQR
jgi:hypothetical protein